MAALAYKGIFAIRRFDLILSNVMLTQDSPISGVERNQYFEKVVVFLVLQTFYIAYLHRVHPHDTVLFNRLELANEYAMFLFGYSMLIFTGLERPVGLN